MKLFSKRSKYNDTDSINNLFKNKAKFNSLYGKSLDEYKKLEEDLQISQNNVSNYIQIEKNIYDKLMDGYIEILNSQPIPDKFKIKMKILSKILKEKKYDV